MLSRPSEGSDSSGPTSWYSAVSPSASSTLTKAPKKTFPSCSGEGSTTVSSSIRLARKRSRRSISRNRFLP